MEIRLMVLKRNKQFFVSIKKISAFIFAFLLVLISTFQISAASYETDGFVYSVSDGNASVTGYKGDKTDIVLPLKLQSWSVSEISDFAFVGKTAITSVRLNEARHLRRIGTDSFYDRHHRRSFQQFGFRPDCHDHQRMHRPAKHREGHGRSGPPQKKESASAPLRPAGFLHLSGGNAEQQKRD